MPETKSSAPVRVTANQALAANGFGGALATILVINLPKFTEVIWTLTETTAMTAALTVVLGGLVRFVGKRIG